MKKPRQVCYLYTCQRCKMPSKRGSGAKYCDLPFSWFGGVCRGRLVRVKTVKGPIPVRLKVVAAESAKKEALGL